MLHEIHYANNLRWRQTAEAATGWERPDKIETLNAAGQILWSTGDYGYDGAGNVSAIGDRTYVYDAFSRFSYVQRTGQPQREQQATYDAYGNLTALAKNGNTRTLTTSAATNRLATPNTVYTSNGEIAETFIDGLKFVYGYDGVGQQLFQQTTAKTWVYAYDANDERILAWECALNRCGEGTSFERYTLRGLSGEVLRVFAGPGRASLAWQEDFVYRDSQPLAWIQAEPEGETKLFLHADHLGSTRQVTSATGVQVARHDFLPFGEESTASGSGDIKLKFTGHERDQPGRPMDYMKARFSSPALGRFHRPDPVMQAGRSTKNPQMWNRYIYAANNPLKYIDPTGRVVELPLSCANQKITCKELGDLRSTVPAELRNFVRARVVDGKAVLDARFLNMMKGAESGNFQALRQIANSSGITMFDSSSTSIKWQSGSESIGPHPLTNGITLPTSQSLSGKIEVYTAGNLNFIETARTTAHELRHARQMLLGVPWQHEWSSTSQLAQGGLEMFITSDPNGPVNFETASAEVEAANSHASFIP